MSGEFDGIDFSSLSDEDWSNLLNGQNNPALNMTDFSTGAPSTYGMGDRGMGEGDPNSASYGTLTPAEIQQLTTLAQGSGNYNPTAFNTSGASGGLGSLLKAIGLGNSSGDMNWPLLMSLLAAGAGGIMSKNATSKATDQILGSIKDANTQVSNILGPGGGAAQSLSPYLSGGAAAMQAMPGMIYKAPGAQFSGPMDARISLPPISLSSIMKRGR